SEIAKINLVATNWRGLARHDRGRATSDGRRYYRARRRLTGTPGFSPCIADPIAGGRTGTHRDAVVHRHGKPTHGVTLRHRIVIKTKCELPVARYGGPWSEPPCGHTPKLSVRCTSVGRAGSA